MASQPHAAEAAPAPYGGYTTEAQLRRDVASLLHATVAAMNVDNFVVRPRRQSVERFAKAESWQSLGVEDFNELTTRVAGLPTELSDEDEEAKRFDMLLLRAQLAILQARPDFSSLREKIQRIAQLLEEQGAIPAIKAEMVLIQAVAADEWWEDVTVPMLETVRRKLRALVKLIPKGQKLVVYTHFEDEIGEAMPIELPQVLHLPKFAIMDTF